MSLPDTFSPDGTTLAGKQVLVTGAATDLGAAVSLACARAGAGVILLDGRARQMESLYDRIVDEGLEEPLIVAFKLDRSNEQDLASLTKTLVDAGVSLHGLVHCALWGAPLAPVELASTDTWRQVMEQQFLTPFALSRHLLTSLQASGGTSVVFTTLDVGRQGRAYWGPVATAFAATESLVQTWADEAEKTGLRINSLDPGKVASDLRKKFYPAESRSALRPVDDPLLMKHYVYLLADESRPLSGQPLTVPNRVDTI